MEPIGEVHGEPGDRAWRYKAYFCGTVAISPGIKRTTTIGECDHGNSAKIRLESVQATLLAF